MNTKSEVFRPVTLLAIIIALSTLAVADAGVFTGNGQSLHQISTKNVQLVSIEVIIVPGRGHFLFDGTVPGMDQSEFYCTFVLKSLSNKEEEVQIGFPVDSQFARYDRAESRTISPKESNEWVSQYSFIARDDHKTYHVEFVRRKPKEGPGEFSELFTWNMSFAPMETRTLTVQYRIPMTMGLTSTAKDEKTSSMSDGPLGQELLNIGMEEVIGYITSTGSSWAGNVEDATFTVITEPFERYLSVRGIGEELPTEDDEKQDEEAMRYRRAFPVKHPWWFRQISPVGWKPVEHGIQWRYKNFKPQDSIVVSYYMTEFPRLPEEVSPFVDQYLNNLSDAASATFGRQQFDKTMLPHEKSKAKSTGPTQRLIEIRRLKQLLLATYGKEPEDPLVKQHVAAQLWYEPRVDFRMESLTKSQKAVIQIIDSRITGATAKLQNAPKK